MRGEKLWLRNRKHQLIFKQTDRGEEIAHANAKHSPKSVNAFGNFSRRTKSCSKLGIWSIESLFLFSVKLHQRSWLLYNLHLNNLLLSQNNENYMFCLDSSLHRLVGDFQEFCQITSRTIFSLFIHVLTLVSFIYIFRLVFLRMRPQLTIRL